MNVLHALVLGIVQGLTEFLPISSSGHLVILQQWFGLREDIFTFDIFIHLATLLAIIIFFGRSLFKVTVREWFMVGVATLPAVFVGLLWQDEIEAMFSSGTFVGLELMVTGLITLYLDRLLERMPPKVESAQITVKQSFLIGIAQAIAIIPGISRSGSTVAGAVTFGLDREKAFRFSFLMAIPALLGAGILQFKDVWETGEFVFDTVPFLIGGMAAFITGILSLKIFRYVIMKAQLQWFGWYCIVLGGVILLIR